MAKILKNTTGSDIYIEDLYVTIPAAGQLELKGSQIPLAASSSELLILVSSGTIIVNNGFQDLETSLGIWLIFGAETTATLTLGVSVAPINQDPTNSTTTPLGAGATYTGTGAILAYEGVAVSIQTDVASTLFIEASSDGINYYPTGHGGQGYSIDPNEVFFVSEARTDVYYRVRLVNGPDAQGSLILNTFVGNFQDYTSPQKEPFNIATNNGKNPGFRNRFVIGYSNSLNTEFKYIWDGPDNMVLPTTNETYEIVSSSPNDSAAGTGARTILIESLDENGLIQNTVVALNGTTPVTVPNLHSFPRSAIVIAFGSQNENEGSIEIRVQGGGDLRLCVHPKEGASLSAYYKVPADCYFHIQSLDYHAGSVDKQLELRSRVVLPGSTGFISTSRLPFGPTSFTADFNVSNRFPPGTIVSYDAKVSSGSGDSLAVILAGHEQIIRS